MGEDTVGQVVGTGRRVSRVGGRDQEARGTSIWQCTATPCMALSQRSLTTKERSCSSCPALLGTFLFARPSADSSNFPRARRPDWLRAANSAPSHASTAAHAPGCDRWASNASCAVSCAAFHDLSPHPFASPNALRQLCLAISTFRSPYFPIHVWTHDIAHAAAILLYLYKRARRRSLAGPPVINLTHHLFPVSWKRAEASNASKVTGIFGRTRNYARSGAFVKKTAAA